MSGYFPFDYDGAQILDDLMTASEEEAGMLRNREIRRTQ
ncbi:hypothetical protein X772_30625 [Mesorhizobium sp. LSJC280B00]|nr:hypothetical protein X772_30625 [Mesorhizobium sp. LSJC280B00]